MNPPEFVTHRGGCHCGAVAFEVDAPTRLDVQQCNCSICSMSGFLHLIVPASRFRLLRGTEAWALYLQAPDEPEEHGFRKQSSFIRTTSAGDHVVQLSLDSSRWDWQRYEAATGDRSYSSMSTSIRRKEVDKRRQKEARDRLTIKVHPHGLPAKILGLPRTDITGLLATAEKAASSATLSPLDELRNRTQTILSGAVKGLSVSPKGDFTFESGSTRVFLSVQTAGQVPMLDIWAPTNIELTPTQQLYQFVATESARWSLGSLSVVPAPGGHSSVVMRHALLGDAVRPNDLLTALSVFVAIADVLDDRIKEQFGGRRFRDAPNEEASRGGDAPGYL